MPAGIERQKGTVKYMARNFSENPVVRAAKAVVAETGRVIEAGTQGALDQFRHGELVREYQLGKTRRPSGTR